MISSSASLQEEKNKISAFLNANRIEYWDCQISITNFQKLGEKHEVFYTKK